MRTVHRFLTQTPYDLYELALFCLVVKHRSFTAAAQVAGLTQSAVTRQIQGIENTLGVPLLKRTTRSLTLTPAGEYLFREAARLVGDVESSLRFIQQEFANAPKEIRVAFSPSIGLAYLPGFFHANLRELTGVTYHVESKKSTDILLALERDEVDVGIITLPHRVPRAISIAHRFSDLFTLIAPAPFAAEYRAVAPRQRCAWLGARPWLLIDPQTRTGSDLQGWLRQNKLKVVPRFAVSNFDLLINLVSLGMGLSLVPVRSLALYPQKKNIHRLPFARPFIREVVVLTRRADQMPIHIKKFVENILF